MIINIIYKNNSTHIDPLGSFKTVLKYFIELTCMHVQFPEILMFSLNILKYDFKLSGHIYPEDNQNYIYHKNTQ